MFQANNSTAASSRKADTRSAFHAGRTTYGGATASAPSTTCAERLERPLIGGLGTVEGQVQCRQQEQRQGSRGNQSADDDDGEGTLHFGADSVRQGHRQQAEHG